MEQARRDPPGSEGWGTHANGPKTRHRPVASHAVPAAVVFGAILTSGGCAAAVHQRTAQAAIPPLLHAQAGAWNRGDIDEFMRTYWRSPDLTFVSGGTITRGWEPTLAGYRRRYPTRDDMGILTFRDMEVREIGRHNALVLGRWHLDREEPLVPVGGRFTLLFRRIDSQWVIVYDHTSKE